MTTTDGPVGGAEATELFTVDQLAEISQNLDPVANDLAGDRAALIPEMIKGGIVTKNQITAFLANICQETDHLNTLEEYGDEAYYRSFLGDEWVYHGRGYIMNTWLAGYQRLSDVLGVDLVSNPDLLAQDKNLAAKAAVWYWNDVGCGPYADQGNFEAVCSLINRGEAEPTGPIHGWEERLAAYERAQAVIGTGTEPVTEPAIEGSETVTEEPEVAKNVLVYTDDDAYIRARENDAYVWVLQGSNKPAKANGNGYIYVPGLPGGGPDSLAALPPTRADTLVSAADSDTWLRMASGSYIQGEGMSDHDLQVNQSGWLWDRTAWEAKAEEVTEEPEVAKNVLVYMDDDTYIRARENDAYVWVLQGSNTPAKADGNGYIWVPGLPGAGPDAAALAPTQADKLVSAADSDTWLRTASGSYIQGEGMSDHDLQVSQSSWLWDRTAWEAKPKDDRFWPVADTPPDPNSWSYVAQHPTRYNWVPSVEKVARDLIKNFPVWCNTYYGHPPPEIVGGVWYDTVSMDVWNPGGRGDTLDWNVHTQVCDYVMNDPNPPMLAWVCSKYYLWTPSAGWQWYSNDTDPATDYAHVYHLHLTFALDS